MNPSANHTVTRLASSECLAGLLRNRWLDSIGIGGWFRRNTQPADRGCADRPGRAGADAARRWRAVERPQGRGLDGGTTRPGAGAPAARLGSAEADRLVASGAATAASAGGDARAEGGL